VVNLSDVTSSSTPPIRTQVFSREHIVWIIATFTLTMLAASVLSYTGFLVTDPLTAAVDGFLVAIVYVGWRVLQAYRVLRLRAKMNSEV